MNVLSKYILIFLLLFGLAASTWAQEEPVQAQAVDSRSPSEIVSSGNSLYTQGSYAEALAEYQHEIFSTDPAAEVSYNQANCHYELGDYDQAMELYQRAAAETSNNDLAASCRFNMGNAQLRQLLETQQAEQPDMKQTLQGLAEAAGYYRQAMELDPEIPGAQNNIALVRNIMQQIIDQMQQQPPQQQQGEDDQQQDQQEQDEQEQQQQQQGDQQQDQDQQQQSEQQQDSSEQDQQDQSEQDQQQQDQSEQQQSEAEQQQQQEQTDQEQQEQEQQMAQAGEEDQEDPHQRSGITAEEVIDRERERQEQQRARATRDRTVERDW